MLRLSVNGEREKTEYFYDENGNQTAIKDANGDTTKYVYYDDRALQKYVIDAEGNTTEFLYDNLGRNTHTVDAKDDTTETMYDKVSRVVAVVNAIYDTLKFDYDSVGNKTQSVNEKGDSTYFSYDSLNHIVKVKDAAGDSIQLRYDENGNRTQVEDGRGLITQYRFDELNRTTAIHYSNSTKDSLVFNEVGNLAKKIDAEGNSIIYSYDDVYNLKDIRYSDDTATEYDYYKNRLLKWVENGNSRISYLYDRANRPELKTIKIKTLSGEPQFGIHYDYHPNGQLSKLTYPDDKAAEYDYYKNGLLKEVTYDGHFLANYKYNKMGRLLSKTYANGLVSDYAYTKLNRAEYELKQLRRLLSSGYAIEPTTHIENRFVYDPAGNREWWIDQTAGDTTRYFYDDVGRLTKVDYNYRSDLPGSFDNEYRFDSASNRSWERRPENSAGLDYIYPTDSNLLDKVRFSARNYIDYEYDDRGNMKRRRHFENSAVTDNTEFEFNRQNQLAQVTVRSPETISVDYLYDSQGNRLAKFGGETRYYLNNGLDVLCELDADGTLQTRYVYGLPGAKIIAVQSGGDKIFYAQDLIGSNTLITDDRGGLVQQTAFGPYGKIRSQDGDSENSYSFAGKEYDEESGLHYFHARYYDEETGRFVSRDPVDISNESVGGANRYAYALNSPFRYVDPTGLAENDRPVQQTLEDVERGRPWVELAGDVDNYYKILNSFEKVPKETISKLAFFIESKDAIGVSKTLQEVQNLLGDEEAIRIWRNVSDKLGKIGKFAEYGSQTLTLVSTLFIYKDLSEAYNRYWTGGTTQQALIVENISAGYDISGILVGMASPQYGLLMAEGKLVYKGTQAMFNWLSPESLTFFGDAFANEWESFSGGYSYMMRMAAGKLPRNRPCRSHPSCR